MAASGIQYPGFESFDKLTDFIKPGKTYYPDMDHHQAYKKVPRAFMMLLYPATVDLMHRLSE